MSLTEDRENVPVCSFTGLDLSGKRPVCPTQVPNYWINPRANPTFPCTVFSPQLHSPTPGAHSSGAWQVSPPDPNLHIRFGATGSGPFRSKPQLHPSLASTVPPRSRQTLTLELARRHGSRRRPRLPPERGHLRRSGRRPVLW
jgi:hypothetical protein